MSKFVDAARQALSGAGLAPPPASGPYIELLRGFAASLEEATERAVATTISRTPTAGGWELLASPTYQVKVRRSLLAVYPDETGVLVYNRHISTAEAFEAFLLDFLQNPTLVETVLSLKHAYFEDVDGWVVEEAAAEHSPPRAYLVANNADFRRMAASEPGEGRPSIRVRLGAHLPRVEGPLPGPEVKLRAEFGGQWLTDATLYPNTDEVGDGWTYRLEGRREPRGLRLARRVR